MLKTTVSVRAGFSAEITNLTKPVSTITCHGVIKEPETRLIYKSTWVDRSRFWALQRRVTDNIGKVGCLHIKFFIVWMEWIGNMLLLAETWLVKTSVKLYMSTGMEISAIAQSPGIFTFQFWLGKTICKPKQGFKPKSNKTRIIANSDIRTKWREGLN